MPRALPRLLLQEMNAGDVPTRFLQVWITPDASGHRPQYGSTIYTKADRHNKLLHILGGTQAPPAWAAAPSTIHLHQDANVYVSESDAGQAFDLSLGQDRQAYLVCAEGELLAVAGIIMSPPTPSIISGMLVVVVQGPACIMQRWQQRCDGRPAAEVLEGREPDVLCDCADGPCD